MTTNPDTVIYTDPDTGATVTQGELDEINRRAARYCVINHIFPFDYPSNTLHYGTNNFQS